MRLALFPRRPVLKRLAYVFAGALVALSTILALNTLRQGSRQIEVPPARHLEVDKGAAARLSAAVQFRTISHPEPAETELGPFLALHEHLRRSYPLVHARLRRETIGDASLLYTWRGTDPSLPPLLLLAHQDVVPIAPGTEANWRHPPFSGAIADDFVWGRGAWDDKGNLIAQLEAVEMLIAAGFTPRRTIYLAFGADEEIGGQQGAAKIAQLLSERHIKLDFVVDEGLVITTGVMPGLDKPLALIGVAEKGYLSVELSASAIPSHSSMPPEPGSSAIAKLSGALNQLDSHPFPASIHGILRETLETVAPELNGPSRVALSNLWLFEPLVRRQLEGKASTNALLRTTTALTVVNAGNKDNVLPSHAQAIVNFRILPGDDQAGVLDHVRQNVTSFGVEFSAHQNGSMPSRVSAADTPSFRLIAKTIRALFPGTVVAPGLMVGATDSRYFLPLTNHVYRFSPVTAKAEDLLRFHGSNERLSLGNLAELIQFYYLLLEESAK